MVVKIGRFVKSKIGRNRLAVNQSRDVILYQLGLGGADPVDHSAHQLGEQQHNSHQDRGPEDRPPVTTGANPGDDSVDQRSGEVDSRDRKKSLPQKQEGPGDGPAGRGLPHQTKRAREVGELKRRATQADDRVF